MKSSYVLIIVVLTLLVGGTNVLAQSTTTDAISTSSPQERPDNVRGSLLERAEAARANINERRTALNDQQQTRLTNLAANLSNRLDAVHERFSNITIRLESRAEKITATGQDVTVATELIENVRVNLETVGRELAELDVAVLAVVGSTEPRTEWQDLRQRYVSIGDQLRLIREDLRAIISELRNPRATEIVEDQTDTTNEE